ncbi:MAG TPA: hypothetical protein VF722_08230 [Gemmatimonadaceae bacterium]|jgi:hypothetical protein
MSVPCHEQFPKSSLVRIADRPLLECFKRDWKYHHPLVPDHLDYAGRIATVGSVGYYQGGDVLYTLVDVPGTWHEDCLAAG